MFNPVSALPRAAVTGSAPAPTVCSFPPLMRTLKHLGTSTLSHPPTFPTLNAREPRKTRRVEARAGRCTRICYPRNGVVGSATAGKLQLPLRPLGGVCERKLCPDGKNKRSKVILLIQVHPTSGFAYVAG